MRILFLDQYSEMGGAQHVLLDVVCAALARGWEAHVAIPGRGPLTEKLASMKVAVSGIQCGSYRSGSKSFLDRARFIADSWRQMQAVRNLIERHAIELVYVNGPRLLAGAAAAVRGRVPLVFHAHSHIPDGTQALVAKWSTRHARATVVACSASVARPLGGSVAPAKLHVIPNGVPDLGFRERCFADGAWRIGIIGRISPEKGQAEFVRAAALLAPQFPKARFVICGAPLFSATKYLDQVRTQAQGLPVEFFGWREDIDKVLQDLDLLACPSKQEGMGRMLVEAFSAGVPAIAFASGGIPEIVQDEVTGFVTADPTAESLAARLREIMLAGPERLRKVATNARRAWEEHYTLEAFQKKITNLIAVQVSDWQAECATGAQRPRK